MALTLIEASKLNSGDVLKSTVIEAFARESDILKVLPFEDIQGGGVTYNRESTLPGIAFRGVNESFTPSTGVVNPLTDALSIIGGEVDVDRFIIRTRGVAVRANHVMMKVKALAAQFTTSFIKGDSTVDQRQFDGLQVRLTGNQLISAGSAAGGAALSLSAVDQAIDQCYSPTHIILSKALRRRFQQAARNVNVGGYITWEPDEFGQKVINYQGLPLLVAYSDNGGDEVLPFTEAAASGAATATSLYVVSLGPERLTGIQNGTIDVRDLGELQANAVTFRTRVEWYTGVAFYHPRAAVRVNQIGNLALVA
jgi:hypothetical protein